MDKKLIIAIDGYSSCGKSTFAKSIARELGYLYIDSGAMYRAVTYYCMAANLINDSGINKAGIVEKLSDINIEFRINSSSGENETWLNSANVEEEIRGLGVSGYVSTISKIPQVRERLVLIQREIGSNQGIVMDGRDIGTVVFPGADVKIFMTASIEIRAGRRYKELTAKGISADFEEIKQNIIDRDIADENRDISPLRRADDAIVLDNSKMTVDEQMTWVRNIIEKKLHES